MDTKTIAACTGATIAASEVYSPHLTAAMAEFKIDASLRRVAMFLANVGHESGGLTRVVENLNYSVEALLAKFGRHRISEADARAFGRTATRAADQHSIANAIYGGAWGLKNLGNDQPGDGWLYRGAGLIQQTGKGNARRLTELLRQRLGGLVPDFVRTPEVLALPEWAAMSAACYWDRTGLSALADACKFDALCDRINIGSETAKSGDSNGWEDRLRLLNAGKKELGIT